MEPQTTPPESGNIVTGGTPQPNPQVPVTGGNGGSSSKKKWLLLVIALVIVVGVVGGVLAANHHSTTSNTEQNQKQDQIVVGPTKPNYGNIKVGSFRYVNACKVLPATSEQTLFAGLSTTSVVATTFAENTLPTSAINYKQGKVTSSCSRSFGSDTPYSDATVTFQIDQYPTTQAAKKDFDGYGLTQAELDKVNQQLGTNDTTQTAPLAGAKDTLYDAGTNISYTLDGNKIIIFTALLAGVPVPQYQQAIIGALPTILANANDAKLAQNLNADPIFGQKIGDSTYLDACKLYTDADFQMMTGGPNNPANVHFSYNYAATTYLYSDISSGAAYNDCIRYSYPAAKVGESIKTEVQYFKTTADASQTIQQNFTKYSAAADNKLQQVSGLGTYAYYRQAGDLTYLDVQKGPYILEFMITHTSGSSTPSVVEYTKAANVLLPKLP